MGHSHLYKPAQGAAHAPVYHAEQIEMMLCLMLSSLSTASLRQAEALLQPGGGN